VSRPILALQGASSLLIQQAMEAFAQRRRREGFRVAGLIEVKAGPDGPGCTGQAMLDLSTGRLYPLAQDLGPCAIACHLDSSAVAEACIGVMNAISQGCDVVVLSKFGKLEANRSGLLDAFGLAISEGLPVLTAVAPAFTERWDAFSAPLAEFAVPDAERLERWWNHVSVRQAAAE